MKYSTIISIILICFNVSTIEAKAEDKAGNNTEDNAKADLKVDLKVRSLKISLSEYLKTVEAENLILAASQASNDAADARTVGIKLPDPMFGLSQMNDTKGTSHGFEISQTVPFPTKLASDHKARKFESQMARATRYGLRSEVLAKAQLVFSSTWAAQEKVSLLQEKYDVVRQHLKLSQASTRSNSSFSIHTLKAESDLDVIENEILEAKQSMREQQIALAELAQQDPNTYRPQVEEPPLTPMPSVDNMSKPIRLEAKRLNVEILKARASQANSEWLPDLNLRYREFGGGSTMMARNKEIMVSATLPFIYFWQPDASSKAADSETIKAKADFDGEKLNIVAKTATLTSRAESLKKQIELIKNKLIPRAEKRMKLVRYLSPRDIESLQEHREAMEVFPELKIKALELRLQYEATIAELMSYVIEVQ